MRWTVLPCGPRSAPISSARQRNWVYGSSTCPLNTAVKASISSAWLVVWEEISRTVALPPRGPGVFGPDVRPILFTLNPAQKEKYLFPVLRGEKTTAFAQSEPDAGSDPGAMRTTAVRKGDHYVINGYKRWITKAQDADFLQLVAATDRCERQPRRLEHVPGRHRHAGREDRPPHADHDERRCRARSRSTT